MVSSWLKAAGPGVETPITQDRTRSDENGARYGRVPAGRPEVIDVVIGQARERGWSRAGEEVLSGRLGVVVRRRGGGGHGVDGEI